MGQAVIARRIGPVLAVGLLHLAVGALLLTAARVTLPSRAPDAGMTLVTLLPERPPPQPEPAARPAPKPVRGAPAAAPRAPLPPREVPSLLPTPAVAVITPPVLALPAPTIAVGTDLGGGIGDGAGAGTASGAGSGGGGAGGTHSQWLSGRIRGSDAPREAIEAGAGGKVAARVVVGIDGRVAACTIVESTGNAALDAATCRVIGQRFRYRPGTDAAGNPVSDEWIEEYTWEPRRVRAP